MSANPAIVPVLFTAAADAPLAGPGRHHRPPRGPESENRRPLRQPPRWFAAEQHRGVEPIHRPAGHGRDAGGAVQDRDRRAQGAAGARRLDGTESGGHAARKALTAPIAVAMLYNPPGVGSSSSIAIPEGQTEAMIPLTANSGAEVQKWKIAVLGEATVGDGPVHGRFATGDSRSFRALLGFQLSSAATEQGKPTDVVIKVENKDFDGPAKVELLGLPDEVTAEPREITQGLDRNRVSRSRPRPIRRPVGTRPDLPGPHHGQRRADLAHAGDRRTADRRAVAAQAESTVAGGCGRPRSHAGCTAGRKSACSQLEKLRLERQQAKDGTSPREKRNEHGRIRALSLRSGLCRRHCVATVSLAATLRRRGSSCIPPDIQLTHSRDRQSFIVVAHPRRRRDPGRHGTAKATLADPALARIEGHTLVPAGRRHDHAGDCSIRPKRRAAGDRQRRHGRAADQLQARRDAGLHAGRLQHRQLSRRRPRQGWVQSVAVRLRSRRRPLPADARNRLPPHQSGPAAPKACCWRRPTARCRTPAASGLPATGYYQTVLRWLEGRRAERRGRGAQAVTPSNCIPPKAVLEGKGATQQFIARAKYSDGTDRDVTNLAVFLTNNDNSAPISRRRPGHGRGPRRGLRHGPLRDLHRGQPGARAAEGLAYTPPTSRRPTTSTSWSTPSCRSCGCCRANCATTRFSCAA